MIVTFKLPTYNCLPTTTARYRWKKHSVSDSSMAGCGLVLCVLVVVQAGRQTCLEQEERLTCRKIRLFYSSCTTASNSGFPPEYFQNSNHHSILCPRVLLVCSDTLILASRAVGPRTQCSASPIPVLRHQDTPSRCQAYEGGEQSSRLATLTADSTNITTSYHVYRIQEQTTCRDIGDTCIIPAPHSLGTLIDMRIPQHSVDCTALP